MSGIIKCEDVVSMVVEEATAQFAPLWKRKEEDYNIIKQYSKALDNMASEFGGVAFEVDVDEIKMTVSISLECEEMIVHAKNHEFYQLAQRAVSFGFSTAGENIIVNFVFPSLWERSV